MDCSLLILDSGKRILPKKSTVIVEQSDSQEWLLHKLGYSPTQYTLYLIPNSSLWAGLTQSTLTALSASNHIAHENIGTLLFEHNRHFSLVLAAKSEERNNVITEGEECSTPKCDNLLHDVGESGYSTYHSSVTTPADDVIMTSSPQCAKLNESCSTIIVSDSEDEIEDPLATKGPTLPGLFSHRLHPQSIGKKSSLQSTSLYFLPPRPKHSSPVKVDISNPNSSYNQQKQQRPTSTRDEVIIVTSSSDEAELASLTTSVGHQNSTLQVSGHSPQSIDEGIVLDSRWEGLHCSRRVENKSVLATASLTDSGQTQCSLFNGEGQVLNQQKASDHTVVVKYGGYELTQADLRTLEPYQWLNDQIINCYMQLLTETYGRRHKVHIMSTFFYTKLSRYGYPRVKRWLRRVDMRRLRLLLVPVHVSMCHWALAAINFRTKGIVYFDLLGIRNTSCLKRLKVFMRKCTRARKYPYLHHWRLHYAKGIPHQQNSNDCGVFVCQFAKWLCSRSRSRSYSHIPFQQGDMHEFRETMLEELKNEHSTPYPSQHDLSPSSAAPGATTSPSSSYLSIDDLGDVLEAVWEARAKWYSIGLKLGISPGMLDAINETANHNTDDCITAVIKDWLKNGKPKPKWEAVTEALKSPMVGCGHLAEQLPHATNSAGKFSS